MTDTTGKTVTLPLGVVVTDIGPGIVNGKVDPIVRRVVDDHGREQYIIARVIRDLPITHRRATL